MAALLQGATEASRIRHDLMRELVASASSSLGQEIALTGSVSWGIELGCWCDVLPGAVEREQWLREAGATDVRLETNLTSEGAAWAMFRFHGIWVEAGWHRVNAHDDQLRAIVAGEVTDHDRLLLASTVAQAVPIRSVGVLDRWQQALSHYPEVLQSRLITSVAGAWTFPNHLEARWNEVYRGHRHTVVEELVRDVHRVLRIVYALNRQWEVDWKWIARFASGLPLKPDRLSERIDGIFSAFRLEDSQTACLTLIRDTLELVRPSHDVSLALTAVNDSLRLRASFPGQGEQRV